MGSPVISVAIPCYNEESNVREITAAVIAELEPLGLSFEIILIDNDSQDRTVELARALCAQDPRVRLIVNSRNFGQMRSPTHAIFAASGQAVIGMCADFQDPPTLLPKFIERWQAGVPIVLGIREPEQGRKRGGFARRLFYTFTQRFSDYPVIPDATGFGLYDRKAVDAIKALNEPEPFFRGMLVETGYTIEKIFYPRPDRRAGKSSNNFFRLLDFALSGLAGSSKKLVRLPFYAGVLCFALAGLCALGSLASLLLGGNALFWFGAAVAEAHFGALFLFLGLIGDQVRLISERTRGTPLVIERERLNFPPDG
jgi:glycosyltransferase involved in cell wall biosynthesis